MLTTLVCLILWQIGLIYASLNIIQSQAYVFNNVTGLFLVLIGIAMGAMPHKREMTGVLIGLAGCVCMLLDPKAARVNQVSNMVPALIDFGSAFFGALYYLLNLRNV